MQCFVYTPMYKMLNTVSWLERSWYCPINHHKAIKCDVVVSGQWTLDIIRSYSEYSGPGSCCKDADWAIRSQGRSSKLQIEVLLPSPTTMCHPKCKHVTVTFRQIWHMDIIRINTAAAAAGGAWLTCLPYCASQWRPHPHPGSHRYTYTTYPCK